MSIDWYALTTPRSTAVGLGIPNTTGPKQPHILGPCMELLPVYWELPMEA